MWIGATHPEVFFYLHLTHKLPIMIKRGQFLATVADNTPICREHYKLVLRLDEFPETHPGQFIQISCRDALRDYEPEREFDWNAEAAIDVDRDEFASPLGLLRRPFSLAGRSDTADGVELEIIHRVVGVGTDWMSHLTRGAKVDILGPLGNRFTLPADNGVGIFVGGGVGIPPMIYLASAMAGRKAVAFCGAVTRDLLALTVTNDAPAPGADSFHPLYNISEFARHGIPAVITTDDGSYGYRGFATQALEAYLDSYFTDNADRARTILYTCGPEPMMKRVAEIAARRNIECQVAVERAMACGMGTCQSCCIRVRKPDPSQPPLPGSDWCYRLACTDGPVFKGTDLMW
jgi:dihydroorotate dehydrogenase electron transfer subunit